MQIKTHIPKGAKINAVHLPSRQMSPKIVDYLNKCREEDTLPDDIYESGHDSLYIIEMMGTKLFDKDKKFDESPTEFQDLLYFMAENEIELLYCDIEDIWWIEGLEDMRFLAFEYHFINDDRLPIYNDDDIPISYQDVRSMIYDN